jgi:hypothetical protein
MQQVNKRVHLPTNAPFTALTDPGKTAAENIAAGTKTGEVVLCRDGNIKQQLLRVSPRKTWLVKYFSLQPPEIPLATTLTM